MTRGKKLSSSFYLRPTLQVARELLGKYLVHETDGGRKLVGKIVETEAYVGLKDRASHASKGKTTRTAPMFLRGGFSYVYLIYGMYCCFNVVTENENFPAAVLIRALEPVSGFETFDVKMMSGPGKLCREMLIDRTLNAIPIFGKTALWIEDRRETVPEKNIIKTKRVGVDYAGIWKNKPWRFYIKGNASVSKK